MDWSEGFKTSGDAAAGCQYIRWLGNRKSERGNVEVVLMIGKNSVVASMDVNLDPDTVIASLQAEMDTIAELLRYLKAAKKTHGAKMRPDGR